MNSANEMIHGLKHTTPKEGYENRYIGLKHAVSKSFSLVSITSPEGIKAKIFDEFNHTPMN